MRSEIQLFRAQIRQVCGLKATGLSYGRNVSLRVLLLIPLIVLACLPKPVCGGLEPVDLSENAGVLGDEYPSDDVPKAIPDKGTTTSTLEITDTGAIADLNVKVNISHEWDGDMEVYLIAPDDTRIELFTDVGGMGSDFTDTVLDDEAPSAITDGSAPFSGSYRPEGDLSVLDGADFKGTWTLEVTDDWSGNTGTLNSWSLIIENEQCQPDPPVIQSEPNVPDGICDIVTWNDVGGISQYPSTDVPKDIPDPGEAMSTLVIGDSGAIEDLNVQLNISHSYDRDLDVFLVGPDGTPVELFTDVGGSGDDFIDTILDDEAVLSITGGSAPFTGPYRPEGILGDLIGGDIQGTWTLQVADDSVLSSGTLNSWSLIADVADVLYYAECATDPDFVTVVADSDWIIDRSHTFGGLTPKQQYWYRVKARPLRTWSQTSQEEFETDTLTDTQTTSDGDVVLAGGGGGLGPEVHVIEEPSFESLDPWWWGSTTDDILVGSVSSGLWASDGDWAGCVAFFYDYLYFDWDYGYLRQSVDWTGVDTLVFDQASLFFGSFLTASVLIGDAEVWSRTGTDAIVDARYGETVDVSAFSGHQDLTLKARSDVWGWFDAVMAWDDLRTYGPTGHLPSGNIVSLSISLAGDDTWDILVFNATIPAKTQLTVDVLPETGSTPIPGYENIPSGTDLSGLSETTIRLQANLSTADPKATPALHDWSVTYTKASCESEWSNVASSQCP